MKKSQLKGVIMLFLTAFIWGTAFVAQRQGVEFIGPITFNAIRKGGNEDTLAFESGSGERVMYSFQEAQHPM